MTEETKATDCHPVDQHVGQRMRRARKDRGLSQTQLGDALGITFQQVQKYERGFNRVSASKLFDAAQVLGLPVSFFFEGLPEDHATETPKDRTLRAFVASEMGHSLLEVAMDVPDGLLRSFVATMQAAVRLAA